MQLSLRGCVPPPDTEPPGCPVPEELCHITEPDKVSNRLQPAGCPADAGGPVAGLFAGLPALPRGDGTLRLRRGVSSGPTGPGGLLRLEEGGCTG